MDYLLSMDYLEPMYCGLSMDYLQNSGLSESMYYGLSLDYLQNSGLSESMYYGLSSLSMDYLFASRTKPATPL